MKDARERAEKLLERLFKTEAQKEKDIRTLQRALEDAYRDGLTEARRHA